MTHYFFGNFGFRWETITGWDFWPAKYQSESDAVLLVHFSDRTPISFAGKEAVNLNDLLKSKAFVLEFGEDPALPQFEELAEEAAKLQLPQLEKLVKVIKKMAENAENDTPENLP